MSSGVPVECFPLSQSNFPANCAVEFVEKAGLFVSGFDLKAVRSLVHSLLQGGKSADDIAATLIAQGYIKSGATVTEVSDAIKDGLADAESEKWIPYSCCKENTTGLWWPYHPTLGWDFTKPCR